MAISSLLVAVSGWNLWLEPFRFHVNCFYVRAAVFAHVGPEQLCTGVFCFICVVLQCQQWRTKKIYEGDKFSSQSRDVRNQLYGKCLSYATAEYCLYIFFVSRILRGAMAQWLPLRTIVSASV